MAKVELKKPVVEEINGAVKDAQAVVLVRYQGVTVEQDTALRKELREAGIKVEEGVFGAEMEVRLINDGPVTIILEKEREI